MLASRIPIVKTRRASDGQLTAVMISFFVSKNDSDSAIGTNRPSNLRGNLWFDGPVGYLGEWAVADKWLRHLLVKRTAMQQILHR